MFVVDIKSNCQKWLYTVPQINIVFSQDISFWSVFLIFFCPRFWLCFVLSSVERLPRLMIEMASCLLSRLSRNQLVTMNKQISVCSLRYGYLSIGVHFTTVLSNINLDLSFDFFWLRFVWKLSEDWPSNLDWF